MIAVLQRVKESSVQVNNKIINKIGKGLLIFIGVFEDDEENDVDFLVKKIAGFRIFSDKNDKMNLSIKDVNGQILVVSQFTLCAEWLKGKRPSFTKAATPNKAKFLYEYFTSELAKQNIEIKTGEFGAMMDVSLINDGPVTFVLDSKLKVFKK